MWQWNSSGIRVVIAAAVLFAMSAAAFGDEPAIKPAVAASAPAEKPEPMMKFKFVNTPVQAILAEMAKRLDFQIVQGPPVAGNVTFVVSEPVTADEAVDLLNNLLMPMGYSAVDMSWELKGQTIRVLRIFTLKEAKQLSPVVEMKAAN